MKKNLHIYVRVSTEIQMTEGSGLRNQIDQGLKVAEKLGFNPIIHNEGSRSSSSDNINERPVLSKLLSDIDDGKIQNVWCFNQDRLSRNSDVWFTIRRVFKLNELMLYVGEGVKYDLSDKMDDFIFGIISEVTKYDQSIRTDRLKRGKLQKLKDGNFWKGGPPPFGYSLKDKVLEVHPTESKWVLRMYEEYSKGTNVSSISDILIKNGVRSRRGNVLFSKESISKILQNTHYEGYYTYTDKHLNETVRVGCKPIVPPKLVKLVRDRLGQSVRTSNYIKTPTLLKEFLRCSHCGTSFGQRINAKQFHKHYYCMGNQQRVKKLGKNSPLICVRSDGVRVRSLNIDDTDHEVWNIVVNVLSNSVSFKESFKSNTLSSNQSLSEMKNHQKNQRNKIKKINKDLVKLNGLLNQSVVESFVGDTDLIDNQKSFIKSVEKKRSELNIQIGELEDDIYNSKQTEKWVDWRKGFDDDIERLKSPDLTFEEKSKFLKSTVKEIVVTTQDKQTHSLRIEFSLPYVEDQLEWRNPHKKKDGYDIIEGNRSLLVSFDSSDRRQKKTQK
jgi:DNA invertase Pin-like site-specific DNA recombinase